MILGVILAMVFPTAPPAHADVPTPSWWNGDCDMNNFPGSHPLGASYNGVTKENPGFWTRRRTFAQVRHGSNIQLLPHSLVRLVAP
jgi:hypothetical protein